MFPDSIQRLGRYASCAGLVALLLCGCGREVKSSSADNAQNRIQELERQVRELDISVNLLAEQKAARMDEARRGRLETEYQERRKTDEAAARLLQTALAEKDARVAELESQAARLKARVRELEQPAAREMIRVVPPPQSPSADMGHAAGEGADLFPVDVSGVRGETYVVSVSTNSTYMETQETYRDEFGNVRKKLKLTEYAVNRYGYRVIFALENKSDRIRLVKARAGAQAWTCTLEPGQRQGDLTVESQPGSPLVIEAGALTRSFAVSY